MIHNKLHTMRWLMPGLLFKRWLLVMLLGLIAAVFGVALILNLQPITWAIHGLQVVARAVPSNISGPVLLVFGLVSLLLGYRKMQAVMQQATGKQAWFGDLTESLYRHGKLDRGPKVVAIGGGTGLSTLLRGLKAYTNNLTAVVTVGDDGGSSGRLRTEQGIIPPGDIRNCIAALADEEHLITELFQYRFKLGQGLEGHSFGNLFLTAMCQVTGDMMSAIKESSKVLNIRGRVLPATLDNIALVAEMEDGTIVRGESNIPEARKRIKHLFCEPANPQPLPEALQAIKEADLIILGPGSLFTSVLTNLLIPELAQAVAASQAPRVYVANMMSQPGETDHFSVADHVQVLLEHTKNPKLLDAVFCNDALPKALIERYEKVGCTPVLLDRDRLEALGIAVSCQSLINPNDDVNVRHEPEKVARAIFRWYREQWQSKSQAKGRGGKKLQALGDDIHSQSALPNALQTLDLTVTEVISENASVPSLLNSV